MTQPPKNPNKQICRNCKHDKYYIIHIPEYDLYRIECERCHHIQEARIALIHNPNKPLAPRYR